VLGTYIDVVESPLYISLPCIEAVNVIEAEEVVGNNVQVSLILAGR